MAALASPLPALAAAGGAIETGTTTYVVNTAKSEIDVTIKLSIKNTKPPDALYDYYYTTRVSRLKSRPGRSRRHRTPARSSRASSRPARTTAR